MSRAASLLAAPGAALAAAGVASGFAAAPLAGAGAGAAAGLAGADAGAEAAAAAGEAAVAAGAGEGAADAAVALAGGACGVCPIACAQLRNFYGSLVHSFKGIAFNYLGSECDHQPEAGNIYRFSPLRPYLRNVAKLICRRRISLKTC
jgi:hypothetical protein